MFDRHARLVEERDQQIGLYARWSMQWCVGTRPRESAQQFLGGPHIGWTVKSQIPRRNLGADGTCSSAIHVPCRRGLTSVGDQLAAHHLTIAVGEGSFARNVGNARELLPAHQMLSEAASQGSRCAELP